MKDINKLTEKDLLILKGNALRLRFKAEIKKTKNDVYQPFRQVRKFGLSLIFSPMVRTVFFKRFVSFKLVRYSLLGVVVLSLLQKEQKQ